MYGKVIKVSFKTYIGMNVYCLLEKKGRIEKQSSKRDNQLRYDMLTDKLCILVPRYLLYSTGIHIPMAKVVVINNTYEQMFSEHLYNFCEAYRMAGFEQKKGIEDFCDKFDIDIDIDITYNGLRKTVYRRRKLGEKLSNNSITELSRQK